MMKRRDFIAYSTLLALGTGLVSCSIFKQAEDPSTSEQQKTGRGSGGSQPGGRTSISGPTDIKSLSEILQRARCPLTDSQIDFLLTLKPGPEFSQRMGEVLDDKQIEAVKNASGGRGGRGGGGGGRRR